MRKWGNNMSALGAGYSIDILKLLDPDWAQLDIDVVTFPAPPVVAKGVLYAEDCWRSDTLERAIEVLQNAGKVVLQAAFTNRGPAFLVRERLYALLETYSDKAVISKPIYCATIGYAKLFESGDVVYASDATLDDLDEITHSCHPGSHTCVPAAPMLTALLQVGYATDNRKLPHEFVFADHVIGQKYFPAHDFSHNWDVDELFRYMTIQDCVGDVLQVNMYPVLSTRLTAVIYRQLQPNGHFRVKHPDLAKYIETVNQFNQIKGV